MPKTGELATGFEPSLDTMFADYAIRSLMDRDGQSQAHVLDLLKRVRDEKAGSGLRARAAN